MFLRARGVAGEWGLCGLCGLGVIGRGLGLLGKSRMSGTKLGVVSFCQTVLDLIHRQQRRDGTTDRKEGHERPRPLSGRAF